MKLEQQVARLVRDHSEAMALLGEICATFSIAANRAALSEDPSGRNLLEIADRWIKRHDALGGSIK